MTRKLPHILRAAIVLASFAPVVHAADITWDNQTGNMQWLDALNWNPDQVPGGGDNAIFSNATVGPANITSDVIMNDLQFRNGPVLDATTSGVVNQSAGVATVNGWVRMGMGGTGSGGTYNLSGGTISAGAYRIAESGGSVATVNVTGGTLTQRDVADIGNGDSWSRLGQDGAVNFNQSGGTVSFDSRLLVGNGGGSRPVVTQTGGTFEVRRGELTIADTSTDARFNVSGGTLRTLNFSADGDRGGNITVGQWDNSNGQLNVSGTAVVQAATNVNIADGRVEFANTGTITQSGGTFTFGGNGQLPTGENGALQDRSFGSLNMARTTSGTATFNLSGGSFRQNDMNNLEDQGGWNRIGQDGNATFNISGGTASFDSRTLLGTGGNDTDAIARATVNQTGGTFEVRRKDLTIGDSGDAVYNISGGTLQVGNGAPITVGQWDNSDSQLNVSATAEVLASGDLNAGAGRLDTGGATPVPTPTRGVITQSGGVVSVGNNVNLATGNASQTGIYNLSGGILDLTGGNINTGAGQGTFNMTGGELRNANVINGNSATAPLNAGSFVQGGGVLVVGATAGAGGNTSINGNYSLLTGGTVQFEIGEGVADSLTVNNGANITLAGNISLVAPTGLSFPQTFTLINNNTPNAITGFFTNAPDDVPFFISGSGYTYSLDYQGGDGNDAVLTVLVPEPGTGALLLAGVAAGSLFGRRRRKA